MKGHATELEVLLLVFTAETFLTRLWIWIVLGSHLSRAWSKQSACLQQLSSPEETMQYSPQGRAFEKCPAASVFFLGVGEKGVVVN